MLISVGRRGVYVISVHRRVGGFRTVSLSMSSKNEYFNILLRWEYYFVTMTIIRANQP